MVCHFAMELGIVGQGAGSVWGHVWCRIEDIRSLGLFPIRQWICLAALESLRGQLGPNAAGSAGHQASGLEEDLPVRCLSMVGHTVLVP